MKKIFFFFFFFAALFAALVSSPFAWAAPMQPGKWLITTRMEMPGMPVSIPPQTHTYCYSKEDIQNKKSVPSARKGCDMKNYRVNGNTVSWEMVCKGKGGTSTTTGEMTSTGTSYKGTMTTLMPGGRKMVAKINGKRLGDCK